MKFREFVMWCNDRAADGCWGTITAITCISIIEEIREEWFWRREKIWREKFEADVLRQIVEPIEQKMAENGIKN